MDNEFGYYADEIIYDLQSSNFSNTEEIIGNAKVALISSGDVVWMGYDGDTYKLGDRYKDFNAIISCVYYEPKPWWKFWKKKKIFGYEIMFL